MKITSHRPRITTLALSCVVALSSGHALAQNDDVGIGKTTTGDGTPPPSESVQQQAEGALTFSGEVTEEWLDATSAALSFRASGTASMDISFVEADGQTPVAAPANGGVTLLEIAGDGSAEIQGHVNLALPGGLDVTLTAAPDAVARTVVLLVHQHGVALDGSYVDVPTLQEVLTDGAGASQALVLGDLAAIDVAKFQRLVEKYEAAMPGLVVTWAFASIDTTGEQHISAVRSAANGSLLEVLTE